MKNVNLKFQFIIAVVVILSGCNPPDSSVKSPSEKTISVIKIKGSDSEYNLIHFFANEYKKQNPEILIEISGGGTGLGLEALIKGEADIANASRSINAEEFSNGVKTGIIPVPTIIALDAVAIITNSKTGIDSLSIKQLAGIFSGQISNWKELGGENLPIKVFGRNTNSGTYKYLLQRLMIEKYADNTVIKNENKDIIQAIASEKGSIAYVSLGAILDDRGKPIKNVWAINTYFEGGRSHSPYERDAVIAGEYPLVRPLYQYTNGEPKGGIASFIQFELSEQQQSKMELQGYFPIMAIHHAINTKSKKNALISRF